MYGGKRPQRPNKTTNRIRLHLGGLMVFSFPVCFLVRAGNALGGHGLFQNTATPRKMTTIQNWNGFESERLTNRCAKLAPIDRQVLGFAKDMAGLGRRRLDEK